MLAMEAT